VVQTVPIVPKDLAFTRRVLREMQEQKIVLKILLKMLSGMRSTSSVLKSSSTKDIRLFTISNVIDLPS